MSVSKVYAKALFEAAGENGSRVESIKKAQAELDSFLDTLKNNATAQTALFAPVTSSKDKVAVIDEVAKKMGMSDLVKRFLQLLARKGRLSMLDQIRTSIDEVRLESQGGILGTIKSADELDQGDIAAIAETFSKKLGHPVELTAQIDPSLLAGLSVTVGGTTYDGSLRGQLNQIKTKFYDESFATH